MGMGKRLSLREVRGFKRNQRIGQVARTTLVAVGAVGFLAMAIAAPNALQILGGQKSRQNKWYMRKVLTDLLAKGLIKKSINKGREGYELTENGETLATSYELQEGKIRKPWQWDGKWRLVMSDIPERLKPAREELRVILAGLGFIAVQKSVLAFPYPCADVITLIKRKFSLNREVLYLEVDILENDLWLRREFGLD